MISDAELDRLEALADAATPGPWIDASFDGVRPMVADIAVALPGGGHRALLGFNSYFPSADDKAFVMAAREGVPALVAEVRRLRAAVASARRKSAEEMREAAARAAKIEHPLPPMGNVTTQRRLRERIASRIAALPLPGDGPAKEPQ